MLTDVGEKGGFGCRDRFRILKNAGTTDKVIFVVYSKIWIGVKSNGLVRTEQKMEKEVCENMPRLEVPKEWDYTTDVLVVGGGTAGLPAGAAAAQAGAKATILELSTICGGSGNVIMVGASFGGTDIQKKQGIEDSPELRYRDGVEVARGEPELWRVYVDHELDTYNWFKEMGIYPWTEELLALPGHSAPRLHRYRGKPVMEAIEKYARDKGAEILLEHRATRLIADPTTDRVLGARVVVKGKTVKNFKARKAVILTCGSFGRNKEMVREYGSRYADCIPLMAPGHLGDGLKMAFELGAATSHIGDSVVASLAACTTTHYDKALLAVWKGGIAVNVNGERFYDESCPKGYYGLLTDAGLDQPGKVYWIVYDEKIRNAAGVEEMEKHKEFKADSIDKLAEAAGINPKGLVATVEKYNSDIDSEGYDTVFGRKHQTFIHGDPVKLDTPPFYAIKCETSITSFKGGLKINSRCQVINVYGEPIPGLYAAGEVTGGLFGEGIYLGGTNWPAAMTFGRVAGRNAAAESPWDK